MASKQQFRVLGTKCASCEIVLERELKTLPGVERVEASHGAGEVTLHMKDGARYRPSDLTQRMHEHGYRFADPQTQEGRAFSWSRFGGAVVIVLALYLLMDRTGLLQFSPSVEGGTGLSAVFLIGVVAAFSSCTAVVGGLIVAVSSAAAKKQADASMKQKMHPHFLFNAGRFVGFALFGALIGLVGQVLTLSAAFNGVLVVLVALLMIGLGINLLEVFPENIIRVQPPKWLSHRIHALSESNHPLVPFVLGALTFFLPCGFTQSMQLYALSTGNPMQAALIMSVFALGTLPALLGIGAITSAARGQTLKRVTRAAGALVIVLGIANVQNGATLLGWGGFAASASVEDVAPIVDGKQDIQMEVTPYGVYVPDTFRVREDIPVNWEIFGGEQMGCGSTLVAPAFGVNQRLVPGYNDVAFTPTEPGEYVFTCSMGMMRGKIIVEPTT